GGFAGAILAHLDLGGLGGVSLASQALGSLLGVTVAFAGGLLVYGLMKALLGIRLSQEEEYYGADLSIHNIGAISHE
ncbi:ammonium transporter, partial [Pseudomonas aeruginosa]|nr:ammonium transporter [Pseudomonas aeruginosa]